MSLTRRMLKAMGIEDEKVDQIVEAHRETVDKVQNDLDEANKALAEAKKSEKRLIEVQKELDEMKNAEPDEYKSKYEQAKKDFDAFKADIAKEKEANQKRDLYRDLLKSNGVDEKRIDAILRVTDLDSIKVEEGAIADSDAVSEGIKKEWAGFIVNSGTKGAEVDNPPKPGDSDKSTEDNIKAVRKAMGLPDKE